MCIFASFVDSVDTILPRTMLFEVSGVGDEIGVDEALRYSRSLADCIIDMSKRRISMFSRSQRSADYPLSELKARGVSFGERRSPPNFLG